MAKIKPHIFEQIKYHLTQGVFINYNRNQRFDVIAISKPSKFNHLSGTVISAR